MRTKIKTIGIVMIIAVFCLSVAMPFANVANGQTFTPNQKAEPRVTVNVPLENKELGAIQQGAILIFDQSVTVNGIYDSYDQIFKEVKGDINLTGTSIDTKGLKTGYYVAYTGKTYEVFKIIEPIPEDAFISLIEIDRVSTMGDTVKITGESNLKNNLTAVIRDDRGREYNMTGVQVSSDGKFDIEINTKNLQAGSYSVLIYCDSDKNIQAVAPLLLTEPQLMLNADTRTTTQGDIKIEGSAEGAKKVEVWLVGNGLAGYTQLIVKEDGTFSETVQPLNFTFYDRNGMISPIKQLSRGTYDVLIVHPGTDGFYHYDGTIEGTGKLLSYPDGISKFTTNQSVSNNYDIINRVKLTVDLPTIAIDKVELSQDGTLLIMGSTNIHDGQKRIIVMMNGIQYFTDIQGGRFTLMLEGVPAGQYRIEAYDIDNTAYASGTFNMSIAPPTPAVSEQTTTVSQPQPDEEKGAFNIWWIIIVILIVVIAFAVYVFFFKKQ